MVLVEDTDVGALLFAAKGDRVLHCHTVHRVTKVVAQHHEIELTDRLFRSELDRFAAHDAGDMRSALLAAPHEGDGGFEISDLSGGELAEAISAVFEEIGKGDGHGSIPFR